LQIEFDQKSNKIQKENGLLNINYCFGILFTEVVLMRIAVNMPRDFHPACMINHV